MTEGVNIGRIDIQPISTHVVQSTTLGGDDITNLIDQGSVQGSHAEDGRWE
jgi:hypothetical protein